MNEKMARPAGARARAGSREGVHGKAPSWHLPPMSEPLFRRLSTLIHSECGIKMPPAKKIMLEARLRKRLRALGLGDFESYCNHLFEAGAFEEELVHLLDVVTTNKTDFFRESVQFDILSGTALPDLWSPGRGPGSPLRVWSAGCASGEESYTIAMVLEQYRELVPGFAWEVLGTDLSTSVLAVASRGIYREERVEPVPATLRRRFLMRSRDRERDLVRVVPELRARVTFRRLNFTDAKWDAGPPQDVIFCRNVLIYFERDFQREVLLRFCRQLRPGGYLFLGHTESVNGMGLPVESIGSSVHRRPV